MGKSWPIFACRALNKKAPGALLPELIKINYKTELKAFFEAKSKKLSALVFLLSASKSTPSSYRNSNICNRCPIGWWYARRYCKQGHHFERPCIGQSYTVSY